MKLLNLRKIAFLTLCFILLSGCFHLQTAASYPENLKTLYFTSNNVYSEISQNIKSKLRGTHTHFVDSKNATPFTLSLSNSHTNVDLPINYSANLATVYTYSMSVTATLILRKNNHCFTIFQQPFLASQNITYNANQVGPATITPLMRRSLTRQLVNAIYYRLISKQTQMTIAQLHSSSKGLTSSCQP